MRTLQSKGELTAQKKLHKLIDCVLPAQHKLVFNCRQAHRTYSLNHCPGISQDLRFLAENSSVYLHNVQYRVSNTGQPLPACHSKGSSFELLQVEYTFGRCFGY